MPRIRNQTQRQYSSHSAFSLPTNPHRFFQITGLETKKQTRIFAPVHAASTVWRAEKWRGRARRTDTLRTQPHPAIHHLQTLKLSPFDRIPVYGQPYKSPNRSALPIFFMSGRPT